MSIHFSIYFTWVFTQTGNSVGGTVRDLDGLRETEQMCVFLVM